MRVRMRTYTRIYACTHACSCERLTNMSHIIKSHNFANKCKYISHIANLCKQKKHKRENYHPWEVPQKQQNRTDNPNEEKE